MATITKRATKGSPLTNDEVDANFDNLNTDKLETSGGSVTGDISFGDNDKAIFGAGSDLQIYHDPNNNSYIEEVGSGSLLIRGDEIYLQSSTGENKLIGDTDGAVNLFYNGSSKLNTTNTGIDVTGTVTADGVVTQATANTYPDGALIVESLAGDESYVTNVGGNFLISNSSVSDQFVLDSSGNVGIGTASPLRSLHISGAGDTSLMLQTTNAVDDNEIWEIQVAGNASNYADLIFRNRTNAGTGGSEAMRITSSGNVGIGTTNPDTKFDVNLGSNLSSATLDVAQFDIGQNQANAAYLKISGVTHVTPSVRKMFIDSFQSTDDSAAPLFLNWSSTGDVILGGNVGIGTASPARQLDIYDDGTIGQAVLAITAQNTDPSRIMFADTDDNNIGILDYDHSDNSMRFTVNNAERMRLNSDGSCRWTPDGTNQDVVIKADGKVGIGTTDPAVTTHIKGSGSTPLKVESTSLTSFIQLTDSGNSCYIGASNGALKIQTPGSSFSDKLIVDSAGEVTVSNALTALQFQGSGTFTQSITNGVLTNVFDLSTVVDDGGCAIVNFAQSTGGQLAKATVLVNRSLGGTFSASFIGTQPTADYFTAVGISGTQLQIQINLAAGSHTIKGRVFVVNGLA